MGRRKPVDLATRSFDNQGIATEYFKEMLGRYKPGNQVNDIDALDLAALLERHDEYPIKVGVGIDHFEVMMTEHGTPCFRIIRKDGSGTDFSYRHCITQRPPTRKQEVSQAFRRVVRFDLYDARDKFIAANVGGDGLIVCAATKERIRPDQAHMDHRPPMTFEVIVTTFLGGRGMALDQVRITAGKDEQVAPELLDEALAVDFRTYHARVAQLDLVKNTINLSQASRQRLKSGRISIVEEED